MTLPVSRCNTIGFRLVLALSLIVITLMAIDPDPGKLQTTVNDKIGHALVFFYLSLMVHSSWPASDFGWKYRLPLLGYGLLIETLQYYIPTRDFSIGDIVADTAGILLYILFLPITTKLMNKIFTLPSNES